MTHGLRLGAYAVLGITIAVLAFLVANEPGTPLVVAVEDVVLSLAAATATVSLALAARRAAGPTRLGWGFAAAGTAAYTLGMLEWTRLQVILGRAVPTPSFADAGFLAHLVLAGVGLLFLRPRTHAGRFRVLLDGIAIAVAAFVVSLVAILLPMAGSIADGRISLADAVLIAYPLGDILLLVIALTITRGAARSDQPTLYILAAAALSMVGADTAYTILALQGRYATGLPTDILWVVGMLLYALAGLRAQRQPLVATEAAPTGTSAILPSLAMAALLTGLLVLDLNQTTEVRLHHPVTELTVIALLLVLVARHAVSAYDHAQLVKRLETTVKSVQREVARRTAALERSNSDLRNFASAASHDLQEPLRTVRSYTTLVERRYRDKLDEDAREFLRYASDASERMSRLIEGLLAYTRIDLKPAEAQPVPSARALEEAQANLAVAIRESRAAVEVETPLPVVKADPAQLSLLFQNLLGNAIKYRREVAPVVRIAARAEGNAWRFSVQDNGIGIDPAYHERVFGIFQRLHTQEEREGSGIGLAICKRIVERHGGRIWVESEPGRGAAFHFTLPAAGGAPA